MIVEGKGFVIPCPVTFRLESHEIRILKDESRRRAEFRRYAHRRDRWGKGLIRNPIFVGLCGEYAVCQLLGSTVDLTLRRCGDRGIDVYAGGFTWQVKTRTSDRNPTLVRQDQACEADWCVGCRLQGYRISVLGYVSMEYVRRCALAKGNGDWYNHVIDDAKLLPFKRAIQLCHSSDILAAKRN